MRPAQPRLTTANRASLELIRDQIGRMLDEIKRNFESQRKEKNILLVVLPSAGKSSLINSLASLILGKYIPVASVGQGDQLTHTYAAHRYDHFGISLDHLKGSPNENKARIIHSHLPNLDDFVGLADENTEELKEMLSLKLFGKFYSSMKYIRLYLEVKQHNSTLALVSLAIYMKLMQKWSVMKVLVSKIIVR